MRLRPQQIHIWSTNLVLTPEQEKAELTLLSPDETVRAQRFHFPIHRMHFIAARGFLRRLLSLYLSIPANEIHFSYGEHNKPYVSNTDLTFNLAHSHDMAVYAFSSTHPVGIDIEFMKDTYDPDVAKRFFSPAEYAALCELPEDERRAAFYRIWSRKEALIKAVGKGLSLPLSSFSVAANDSKEIITLDNRQWQLIPLPIHREYQSAVACDPTVTTLSHWEFFDDSPREMREF